MLQPSLCLLFLTFLFQPSFAQVDQAYLGKLMERSQKVLQKDSCSPLGDPNAKSTILLKDPEFSNSVKTYELREPLPRFKSADEAATAFGDFSRKYFKQQFLEYCSEIIKDSAGTYSFRSIVRGSPGGCRLPSTSQNRVGVVHTHPEDETSKNDLRSIFQVFSANDIEYAEQNKIGSVYLVAPGGHVLRYDSGTSACKSSTVMNPFKMIRAPRSSAKGKLLVGPQEFVPFPSSQKPSYCPK